MKKTIKTLLLGLAFIGSQQLMAQTTIKGVFADSLSNERIPFATVAVTHDKQPANFAMTCITDVDGTFKGIVKDNGKYQITLRSTGKRIITKDLVVSGQKTIDLGRVLTSDLVDTLGVIEVVAIKPLIQAEAGQLTYNAQGDPESKTASVLDLLRKVPMVSVDGEDNITINGNSSFQVHVNGKKNQMMTSRPSESLRAMPASAVLDIKIITDPGAKYDAEGVGGIIDLITEKGHKLNQTSGTVTIGTSTRKENKADFNIATNQNKLTVSVSGSVSQQGKQDIEMEMMMQNLSTDANAMNTSYTGIIANKNLWGNLDLQASYDIDTLNLISINGGASNSCNNRENDMAYVMYSALAAGSQQMLTNEYTTSDSKWKDVWAGFDYQHNFKHNPQSMITFSYRFSGEKSDNPSTTTGDNSGIKSERHQQNNELSSEHTLQLDYILPIGKHLTLEDGLKYIYRPKNSESSSETHYTLGQQLQDAGMATPDDIYGTTLYSTDDKIAAAYLQLTAKFSKYTLKGGVRYEYTHNNVDNGEAKGGAFSKNYSTTVPTASLTYNITPMSNFSFSYGMRISRPGIWFLNPFVDKSNPTSWSYGNSGLTPEKYHNFSLAYGKFGMKQSLNLSLRYSTCGTGITRRTFIQDNIMHNTYINGTDNNNLSLNCYYGYNFSQKTRVMANLSASYTDLNNDETNESNHGWSGNIYGQFNQTIFWNIKASLGMMVSLRSYNINGYSDGMSFGTLSFTREFFDKKLTASVSGMCTLNHFDKMVFKSHSENQTYISDMRFEIPIGRIQFSLTYRFGKNHVQVKKSNVSIDNDDAGGSKQSDIPSAGM